ncbi:MAG TPA: HAMP domain-containing sensor histidine kinase [Anaeromyxobacter sp.]
MNLAARIWIYGALVPFLGSVGATLGGAAFFRAQLERALDDALLVESATEAVSLFDHIGVHLHMAVSPLEPNVRRMAPAGALYGPDGKVLYRHPQAGTPLTDASLDIAALPAEPVLTTRTGPQGKRLRVVTSAVTAPDGRRHAIQLVTSLEHVESAVRAFRRIGLAVSLALGAGLFAIQGVVARRLARRVAALSRHMAALREGNLDAVPPGGPSSDEIGELSRVVGEATERLRGARAAQERLIAEAAHELRTPLQFMRTSLDLGLRRERRPEELKQALTDIRGEVSRLARLATRLLDLATARRGNWDRTPGDLVAVACDAAEAIRGEAEGRSVLVEVDAPEPVPASFDANGIRQALDNLLANALRFGPAGGTVRVEVRRVDGYARILVHDDGPGIAPADRERVFEAFERGRDRTHGGAGLGLAIVREVARGHDGRAFVPEESGGNVVIEIPAR